MLYLYYVKVSKCRVIVTFYLPLWLNETHFPGSKLCSLLWGHFLPKKLFWILAYYVKEGEDLSHPLPFLYYGFPKDSIRHTLHGIVRWYDGIPRPVAIGGIKDLGVNMYIDTGLRGTLYAWGYHLRLLDNLLNRMISRLWSGFNIHSETIQYVNDNLFVYL